MMAARLIQTAKHVEATVPKFIISFRPMALVALLAGPAALVITGAVQPAFAQKAAPQKTGPNGGMVSGKNGHETELVVGPTELTAYVLHDGKADDTKGTKIKAVIQQAGKNTMVDFADVGGKKLVAKLAEPLAKGSIVVVTGKDHHGDVISARFVVDK
jgi:hypothetical protein